MGFFEDRCVMLYKLYLQKIDLVEWSNFFISRTALYGSHD